MSESFVRLNAMRVQFHIQHDLKWKKLTQTSLLKKGKDELFDANLSKFGEDGAGDLSVRRLLEDMNRTNEEGKWKDKGLSRINALLRDEEALP